MMIEEMIRYAIDGMSIDDNLTPRDFACKTQDLIDVLINFPNDTDKDIQHILANYRPE